MSAKAFTADDPALTMNYPGFVFRALLREGHDATALLDGTGLVAEAFQDPEFRCRFWQHQRFLKNAMTLTGEPYLGPRLAQQFDPNNIGLPAYAAMSSDSFAAAIAVAERFFFLTFPILSMDHEESGDMVALRWRTSLPAGETAFFVLGSALVVSEKLFGMMLRRNRVIERAEFATPEPAGWAAFAPQIRLPVSFDAPENRAFFPSVYLGRPLASADPINHRRLMALCEQLASRSAFEESFSLQVANYLAEIDNINASLEEAAAAFGCSARSFRRRLESSGTSYRRLSDEARERRAREMLANTMRSIQSIAFELGFNEPSNFARSFKRWTGASPKAYRDSRGAGRN